MRIIVHQGPWKLELVRQAGDIAMFKRSKPAVPFHLEVVRLRYNAQKVMPDGAVVPEGLRYPTLEAWGKDGFTYLGTDRVGADRRYAELVCAVTGLNSGALEVKADTT